MINLETNLRINLRTIVCSYKLYSELLLKFPDRPIEASAYLDHNSFYYYNRSGRLRRVDLDYGLIWTTDYDRGYPFMLAIRRFKPKYPKVDVVR